MEHPDIQAAIAEAAAHFKSGQLAKAEEVYRRVVAASPAADRFVNLGVICRMQGKHDEAVAFLQKAASLEPGSADVQFKLGRAHQARGDLEAAAHSWRRAAELNPRHADALSELGCVYLERATPDEAAAVFRRALAADPRHYYAHNNLGIALRRQGRTAEAIACHERAIALMPGEALAHDSLGLTYAEASRPEEAIACYRKAVALNPAFAASWCNLGNALVMSLRVDEARTAFERAIALAPGRGTFHWNYSNALLLAGELGRGWEEYEWRWQAPELRKIRPAYAGPEWRGEHPAGKTVLLYDEQGFGDAIQFVRYARNLADLGAKVVLATRPELARLLARADGVAAVIDPGEPPPPFDFHCALLSLPLRLGTTLETTPARIPYLRPDPSSVAAWRDRLAQVNAFRVGLIWGGKQSFRFDSLRSCALADFGPLAAVGGTRFYSLQKGEQAAQARHPPAGLSLTDWTPELRDFADTAALVENLDLVISVDTAGAHLAGALGKPVWLLNRHQTEWRWLLGREDSPWYPTLRLFRQPAAGDWAAVIEKARAALEDRVQRGA